MKIGTLVLLAKQNIFLLLVFFIALFVRTYQLETIPRGFYIEEVTNAYVGRFIFQNGQDIFGNPWPLLYFDKFGDYPPVLPLYLSGIATFFLGTTVFAARFSTALFGTLMVFPVYALVQMMFRDRRVSLFAALFIAVLPWHVVLSRTSAEGIVGLTVFTFGLQYLFQSIEKKRVFSMWVCFVLFLLSYFLYPSLRIIIPLALLPIPFIPNQDQKIKRLIVFSIIFFFGLTILISSTAWGRARFEQTSLFHSKEIKTALTARLMLFSNDEGSNNITLARIFHNKVVGYAREFIRLYLDYFSPSYLFLEAGGQPRYYNVPDQGVLYIFFFPLLLLGLIPTQKKINMPLHAYVVYLLAITPISAALTIDFVPHVHRSVFMTLPFVLLAAGGIFRAQHVRYKIINLYVLVTIALIFELLYFWHQYSRHAGVIQSVLRNDGDTELTTYLKENRKMYDKIFLSGSERYPMYYLYFTNNFDSTLVGQFKSGIKIDKIGTLAFIDNSCPSKFVDVATLPGKTLVVDEGYCDSVRGLREISKISRKDGTIAYKLLVPEK